MDEKLIKKIIEESDLPEGYSSRAQRLAAAPVSERRELIRRGDLGDENTRTCAAVEIQRLWRGYFTRCHFFEFLQPGVSDTAIYSESKQFLKRLEDVRTPSPVKQQHYQYQYEQQEQQGPRLHAPRDAESARRRLKDKYERYVMEMEKAQEKAEAGITVIMSFEVFCAQMIKKWWQRKPRTKSGKVIKSRDYKQSYGQYHQSVEIPSSGTSQWGAQKPKAQMKAQKPKREGPPTRVEASIIIQRSWRRHIDIQVFRYYRDLINFRNRGDPSMMLRCINPAEAKMLDAASGIHIKFRLAGDRFPPNIYYKVFTHRPVQDLCANSPKDYTKAPAKMKMGRDVHNRGRTVPLATDKAGWYERIENNGWRLVSDRLISHPMADPITWETSNRKMRFSHSKLQRRQDIEHKKKQKKLEWMKKMYRDGMLHAKTDDKDTIELIEGATAGMVATVEKLGVDAVQDWEVDELLHWTTSLNFDDYMDGWGKIATSAASEKIVYERLNIMAGTDPYEFSISPSSSHLEHEELPNKMSRNTPVSNQSPAAFSY